MALRLFQLIRLPPDFSILGIRSKVHDISQKWNSPLTSLAVNHWTLTTVVSGLNPAYMGCTEGR